MISQHVIAYEDQLEYAMDHDRSAGFLAHLVDTEHIEVLVELARNPNIDAATIEELAFKGSVDAVDTTWRVRAAIAQRTDLPLHVAEGLRSDRRAEVKHYIGTNPSVAPYLSWDGGRPALNPASYVRQAVGA